MDTTLSFQEGRSDKLYRTWLEGRSPAPTPTFEVLTAWGRRGSTMQTGSKGIHSKGEAEAVQRKLVAEKVAKGYRAAAQDATQVQVAAKSSDGKQIGGLVIAPMLLNEVSIQDAEQLLLPSPHWCTQMKFDGVRCQIQRKGAQVLAFSRTNKPIAVPKPILDAMLTLKPVGEIVLDGEIIGDSIYLFDLISWDGQDYTSRPYNVRLGTMETVLRLAPLPLQPVVTATEKCMKAVMYESLRQNGAEGIVFKRLDAPYTPGRPNSGGMALKLKFVTTASVIVAGPNGTKRSVEMKLADGTPVGSVTIPPNKPVPPIGAIIEVRYLTAHRGGSLSQPVYLGEREDVEGHECSIQQLQFKGEPRTAGSTPSVT